MAETEKSVKKNRKKKNNVKGWGPFILALVLFILPFAVLGWILLGAAMDTGSPILGDRYANDLNPAITKSQLDTIKDAVKQMLGVESADVELATGTLRVYADISDDATVDTANSVADQIYSSVTSTLDPAVYFTQHDNEKMYDLEIHVYNYADSKDRDSDSFVYVIDTKTSSMDAPAKQTMSEPLNAELAQQLRQAVEDRNNPQPSASANAADLSGGSSDLDGAADEGTINSNEGNQG